MFTLGPVIPTHITINHVISFDNGVMPIVWSCIGGFLLAWMLLATSKK